MATMHPLLANHPDAIPWPESHDEMTPEFIEQVMAVCSRPALLDIARAAWGAQQEEENSRSARIVDTLEADNIVDPRIHPSLQNVLRIPSGRPLTDDEMRAVFPGNVDAVLRDIVRLITKQENK